MITLAQLQQIAPGAGSKAVLYLPFLNAAMTEFGITTVLRQRHFLTQICHETGDLQRVEENLNYSAAQLCKTWPTRFQSIQSAMTYERQPQKIADYVYANRYGNGDTASGDGWRHRGAGMIQLTFKSNQAACAAYFKIDVSKIGDWLRTPEGACRSAAWFWKTHNCNVQADRNSLDGVSDMINIGRLTIVVGDAIGYADRRTHLAAAEKAIV